MEADEAISQTLEGLRHHCQSLQADLLENRVTVTTLAQGVPIGGELDYLDDGTISAAMKARKAF